MPYKTPNVHLQGNRKFGARRHWYYIAIPKKMPGTVKTVKNQCFRKIVEGLLPHKIQLLPSDRGLDEVEDTLCYARL